MIAVPIRIAVPGEELSTAEATVWMTFAVHGFLRLRDRVLEIEWTATASTDAVEGMDVRSDVEQLATECVRIEVSALSGLELHGGWWRPRLCLVASDLVTLADVPGHLRGRVVCAVARRDRALARELVSQAFP